MKVLSLFDGISCGQIALKKVGIEVEKYYAEYKIVEDLSKVEDELLKFTICDFISSENNSFKYFEKYMDIAPEFQRMVV